MKTLFEEILLLLQTLISTQSFSREEEHAAEVIRTFLQNKNIAFESRGYNTWAYNQHFDATKPTILLNSHIDTVKPSPKWTKDPFVPIIEEGKLYGLGSNDAGGALVALLGAFVHFYDQENLNFNLLFAATAEEEISGQNGIASISDITEKCTTAIVGEPTEMQMAISERGLLVIDATVHGQAGHAARDTGINAIYLAMEDIAWFKNNTLDRICPVLGPTKTTVTVIEAGKQHNVVPDICKYVVDVRTTSAYSYDELLEIIRKNVHAEIQPRSTRLQPSIISEEHSLVKAAKSMGIGTFGSATLSDQALLKIPSVKIGPGKSERSHTADEFIYVEELKKGLETYIELLKFL